MELRHNIICSRWTSYDVQSKKCKCSGTTLNIDSNIGGIKSLIIPPFGTMDFEFTCFGAKPLGWKFDISTNSDAFIVTWELFSTWTLGDPPNG